MIYATGNTYHYIPILFIDKINPFKKEETVESSPWGGVCISEGGVFLWQRIRKSKKFLRQKMAGL